MPSSGRFWARPCPTVRLRTWWKTSRRPISSCASGPTSCSSIPASGWGAGRSRKKSMRLVQDGRVIDDRLVRVIDVAPVPDGVPVSLPAARLLADARELVLRQAPTGVIWPNDRRVAELLPYLDWIALVALVFPTFRDGRAYSQARLL